MPVPFENQLVIHEQESCGVELAMIFEDIYW